MEVNFVKYGNALHGIVVLIWGLFLGSCNENTIDPTLYGSIEGSVVYASDSLPFYGAEVTTTPASMVIYTDSAGAFFLPDVPAGEVSVSIKAEGFRTENKKVFLRRDEIVTMEFRLTSNSNAPVPPASPVPGNGETTQATEVTLKWTVPVTREKDLSFDVVVYEGTSPTPVIDVKDLPDSSVVLKNLKYNTHYFWQVVVKNSAGGAMQGPLWTFNTGPFPDNRYLFVSEVDANYEIFSSNAEGSTRVRLTYTPAHELSPLYDPARERIAFVRKTFDGDHIFVMDKDGANEYQVTTLPVAGYHAIGRGFCWSPDGSRILYSHYNKLYSIDDDGGNLKEVAVAPEGRHFAECDWSGDGASVIVTTLGIAPFDSDIRLIVFATGASSLIIEDGPGTVRSPAFSVDGRSIVYTYDVSEFESPEGRQLDARIFLYNLTTQTRTDLSKEKLPGTNDLNPRLSPDGAKVIFENASNDDSGGSSVWVVNTSDFKRQKLFDNAHMPDWQ